MNNSEPNCPDQPTNQETSNLANNVDSNSKNNTRDNTDQSGKHTTRLQRAVLAIEKLQSKLKHLEQTRTEPIAIVGIGCRFPGQANTPSAYWELLRQGINAVGEVPQSRWNHNNYFDPDPDAPGKMISRWAGLLENIDQFDPYFFGIAPREAHQMEPQQRLLLELAKETFDDAGMPQDKVTGSRTGVFAGVAESEYAWHNFTHLANVNCYTATGSYGGIAANRISYLFDLRGPSFTTDSICSSSLLATHLACESLRNDECDAALAGGVCVLTQPDQMIWLSKLGVLSPDGQCKAFDARANGIVLGEGGALILLKRLSRALADGDRIYATICGNAVSQDGRSNGLTAPTQQGQEAMLREAYRRAKLSPTQVQYIDGHGTGTVLGDPIEAAALGAVLAPDRGPDQFCYLGSVKTNLAHLGPVGGVASLIKVALAIYHRQLPPSLHFENPNPRIPFDQYKLRVPQTLMPWPRPTEPLIGGASSLAFGGTNVHVVLQEAPGNDLKRSSNQTQSSSQPESSLVSTSDNKADEKAYVLPISAHSSGSLQELVSRYHSLMVHKKVSEETIQTSLADLCYTAAVRRSHYRHRQALVVRSRSELIRVLDHLDSDSPQKKNSQTDQDKTDQSEPNVYIGLEPPLGRAKLSFVFSGQGSQFIGMSTQLMQQEPIFLEMLNQCEAALKPYVSWSLLEELGQEEANSRFDEIDVIQPILFALQVSLAALWRSWGVEPDVIVGHSMGEVAAAYVAGALSLENAAQIICHRSRLMRRLSGQGAMVLTELSLQQAESYIAPYRTHVSIAVNNSRRSTVLSGDPKVLETLVQTLEQQGIFHRWVKVDIAAHSPQVERLQAELSTLLDGISPKPSQVPFYSTVLNRIVPGCELDSAYWVRNLREPVQFAGAIHDLIQQDVALFLEMSPHPLLKSAIEETCCDCKIEGIAFESLRKDTDDRQALLSSLAALYCQGQTVNWSAVYPQGKCITLPAYAWQRERFWLSDAHPSSSRDLSQRPDNAVNLDLNTSKSTSGPNSNYPPLLRSCLEFSLDSRQSLWQIDLSADWLQDHQVQGLTVVPAAVYLNLALGAIAQVRDQIWVVTDVTFESFLSISIQHPRVAQLVLSQERPEQFGFKVLSRQGDALDPGETWTKHAMGTLRQVLPNTNPSTEIQGIATPSPTIEPSTLQQRYPQSMTGEAYYADLERRGGTYGEHFRLIQQICWAEQDILVEIKIPDTPSWHAYSSGNYSGNSPKTSFHPILLDACFQGVFAKLPQECNQAYVPASLTQLWVGSSPMPGETLWSAIQLQLPIEQDTTHIVCDIQLLNDKGEVLLKVNGLCLQKLPENHQVDPNKGLWTLEWQVQELSSSQSTSTQEPELVNGAPDVWVLFSDRTGVADALQQHLSQNQRRCILVHPGEALKQLSSTEDKASSRYEINPNSPEQFEQLLQPILEQGCGGLVYLWGLDIPDPEQLSPDTLQQTTDTTTIALIHLLQALKRINSPSSTNPSSINPSPRLWLISTGAQVVEDQDSVAVGQTALTGLGRTIALEYPELECCRIDVGLPVSAVEIAAIEQELLGNSGEREVVLRSEKSVAQQNRSKRYVPRLVPYTTSVNISTPQTTQVQGNTTPFQLTLGKPGLLESLTLSAFERPNPAPCEVEIEVEIAGLNFMDVVRALNLISFERGSTTALTFGMECVGKVSAIGSEVTHLQVGQTVLAVVPRPRCISTHVTTIADLVLPIPPSLETQQAITLPICYLTADYSLRRVGGLVAGERVLIHAGAGGVGLAAIQIAQAVGAEIFATAGTPQKRDYLSSLGINHVFDSRSLEFVEAIRERTQGEGVDVVLNSLAGTPGERSLSLLAPFGRFLEIGKQDIFAGGQLPLEAFHRSLTYAAIDVARLLAERPKVVNHILKEILAQVEAKTLALLPCEIFPVSNVEGAFRHMAQAKHIGKIGISFAQTSQVTINTVMAPAPLFNTQGTYLITGGLGGLGKTLAQWLVDKGVKSLALMGRHMPTPEDQAFIQSLEAQGSQVRAVQANVTDRQQVHQALTLIEQEMLPLVGVFHGAGALADALLQNLTPEQMHQVMAPKVKGSWILHELTQHAALDCFVLFSSTTALLGSPGQGNYAAANAFLDGLAHYRRAHNLPALSINWGPWLEVGGAARMGVGAEMASRGLGGITPEQGLNSLELLLRQQATQVGVVNLNVQQWIKFQPRTAETLSQTLFASLVGSEQPQASSQIGSKASAPTLRDLLAKESPGGRRSRLEFYLRDRVAEVLGLSVDRINLKTTFLGNLGFDSLRSLELRNRLEIDLGLTLSATLIWNYPTFPAMASYLADCLEVDVGANSSPITSKVSPENTPKQKEPMQKVIETVAELSEEQAEELLLQKLESL